MYNILSLVNPFANKPWFLRVCTLSLFENSVGKGEIVGNQQFILFPQCFPPIAELSSIFHQILNCRLQPL